jgi:hypothetical protein
MRFLTLSALLLGSLASQAQANLLANGDFSQGTSGWTGFYNLVDNATALDDPYYNDPLTNLYLNGSGMAEFEGRYDPPTTTGPWAYMHLLMPMKPHLSQTLDLAAGSYTLSWDDVITAWGTYPLMTFEVLLDNVQIFSLSLWQSGSVPSGQRTVSFDIASAGSHSLSFGMGLPGGNIDSSSYNSLYIDHYKMDNVNLVANTAPVPEPETWALLLAGLGLIGLRANAGSRR